MNPNEIQIGGMHYRSDYQHWDYVREGLDGRYLEGCVTKYVYRWRKKNGLEDLRKAMHYLSKLMEAYSKRTLSPLGKSEFRHRSARMFVAANDLKGYEEVIVMNLAEWSDKSVLLKTQQALLELIEEEIAK